MSIALPPTVTLERRFAGELAELALPWQAAEVTDPELLALNEPLATELGLDPGWLRTIDGRRLLVGNLLPAGATPVAQAYAGHQFGSYSPRLGDGRALLLGELVDADGRLRDLHLKGSGRTPFARGGDGLAAVGPMLREFVVSEAMHALGIPTTRSLAVLATGRQVRRETLLPGAVLARVASSHLRVGSFQYARSTDDIDLLRRLADHAIGRHYPDAAAADNNPLPGAVRSGDHRPGVAGGAVDAGGIRARRDEHRQHDDLRRDHRLRAVRLYGGLRPGHGLQLDRHTAAVTPTATSRWWRSGTSPGWPRPCSRCSTTTRSRRSRSRSNRSARSPRSTAPPGRPACAPNSACPTASTTRWTSSLVDELLTLLRENHVDYTSFFRALGAAARGDAEPARGVVLDLATFDAWLGAGARWVRTPTRWTG